MAEAIADVRELLADPVCRAFIDGGVQDEGNALDLFNEMVASTNPRAIYNSYLEDDGSAFARGGRLADEGNRPVLVVFRAFHETTVPPELYNRPSGGDYAYQLTPRQARALIVLHELRHITGTLDGTHNGNPIGENEDTVRACIPAAQPVGGSVEVRAPQDRLPTIDGPIIVPIVPPFPEERLSESDEPVLLVPDLTIIGEDGSVIEGGDVYDPNLDPDYPATDPTGPYCWPEDCVYPDAPGGEPYDPGYGGGGGGGSTDPDWGWDDWDYGEGDYEPEEELAA
jgi:hypothetical protein